MRPEICPVILLVLYKTKSVPHLTKCSHSTRPSGKLTCLINLTLLADLRATGHDSKSTFDVQHNAINDGADPQT